MNQKPYSELVRELLNVEKLIAKGAMMSLTKQIEFIQKKVDEDRDECSVCRFKEGQMRDEEKILDQQRSFYRATVWSLLLWNN